MKVDARKIALMHSFEPTKYTAIFMQDNLHHLLEMVNDISLLFGQAVACFCSHCLRGHNSKQHFSACLLLSDLGGSHEVRHNRWHALIRYCRSTAFKYENLHSNQKWEVWFRLSQWSALYCINVAKFATAVSGPRKRKKRVRYGDEDWDTENQPPPNIVKTEKDSIFVKAEAALDKQLSSVVLGKMPLGSLNGVEIPKEPSPLDIASQSLPQDKVVHTSFNGD